jgi:L-amino acid N-acyltransferase YncA
MIRKAKESDLLSIVRLGKDMVMEGRYSHAGYDADKIYDFAKWYIESPDNLLLVSEINGRICGFFFGYISDFYFSHALMAGEELWYMDAGHRGRRDGVVMVKKFIDWARSKGAIEISAGISLGVDDSKAGKVLKALGFDQAGENYKMRIA